MGARPGSFRLVELVLTIFVTFQVKIIYCDALERPNVGLGGVINMAKKAFDPKEFIASLGVEAQNDRTLGSNDRSVHSLRRLDLVSLVKHMKIEGLTGKDLKKEYQRRVALELLEQELVSEEYVESLEAVPGGLDTTTVETEAQTVEIVQARAKAEREKLVVELSQEVQRIEAQAKADLLAAQARVQRAEAERIEAQTRAISQGIGLEPRVQTSIFDPTRHTRLVPPFQEKDLEAYFEGFEHTANTLQWPKDQWTILLATALKGKAQTVYAHLEPAHKLDYAHVKHAILAAFEEVPERYRTKFRTLKKQEGQTYTDYVKEKERLFEKWRKSRKVDTFDSLKNLILLEDFKDNVPKQVRIHLDDLEITDVEKAARRVDDYAIVHKGFDQSSVKEGQQGGQNYKARSYRGPSNQRGSDGNGHGQASQGKSQSDKAWCDYHNVTGHSTRDCRTVQSMQAKGFTYNPQKSKGQNPNPVFAASSKATGKDKTPNKGKSDGNTKPQVNPVNLVTTHGTFGHRVGDHSDSDPYIPDGLAGKRSPPCEMYVGEEEFVGEDSPTGSSNEASDSEGVVLSFTTVDQRFANYVRPAVVANVLYQSEQASAPSMPSTDKGERSGKEISVLRDTGSSQTLLLEGILDIQPEQYTGQYMLISGITGQTMSLPLCRILLDSDFLQVSPAEVVVALTPSIPVEGCSLLLGNDLGNPGAIGEPVVSETPFQSESSSQLEAKYPECFPTCVVTRSMEHRMSKESERQSVKPDPAEQMVYEFNLSETFLPGCFDGKIPQVALSGQQSIVEAQKTDLELAPLFAQALEGEESEKVSRCFVVQDGLLLRKWRDPLVRSDDSSGQRYQIVAPKELRDHVLVLAHDNIMSGHLGVKKTKARVLQHFWWPRVSRDVAQYVRTCHVCQVVGKAGHQPKRYPLKPIPVVDSLFDEILVDIVGPLPRTSRGNEYILTILETASRFPEATPLRRCTSQAVTNALLTYFTMFGIPKRLRSDQGTHFSAQVLQETMKSCGVQQIFGVAYRPQTQGAVERFHSTLKTMIKTYVQENKKDWDVGLPFLMFAARTSIHDALGFSPADLVFGHSPRSPLKLLKDQCFKTEKPGEHVSTYVTNMKSRLQNAVRVAHENLQHAQMKMKEQYDVNTAKRRFYPGDQVLVLLPVPRDPLSSSLYGPYVVKEAVDDINYVVVTPDRRKKTQKCHINQMRRYMPRQKLTSTPMSQTSVSASDNIPLKGLASPSLLPLASEHGPESDGAKDVDLAITSQTQEEVTCGTPMSLNHGEDFEIPFQPVRLGNSAVLADLSTKLQHLAPLERDVLAPLIKEYSDLFPDVPGRVKGVYHDVDVGESSPIKQHPYRVGPVKAAAMDKEIQYMLDNDIIEPSNSPWSSPCHTVPKSDGSIRFVTDFRKVNEVSKTDSYPLPRIDTLIDEVANARYITKLDLLKGYWQVPLTERAKEISAFSTGSTGVGAGLFQYKVCPFGMKNSGASFQRLMDEVVRGLHNTKVYVDDLIVYSTSWDEHVRDLEALFQKLRSYGLTVNLVKSEFCRATVQYLGHIVGSGQILPSSSKVQAIKDFPVPTNRKGVQRLIGLVGYYRKFCPNLSTILAPLTDLNSPKVRFQWSDECQKSFERIKRILSSPPVLVPPEYSKYFKLYVDASEVGIGAVLVQDDEHGIERPISYFSKKLLKYQKNYSTVEKEALALLLALKFYDVYLSSSEYPVQVYTDHNPLVFVHRMKDSNQRLLRWSLTLQEYCMEIFHVKGCENVVADALSRA